MKKVKEKLNNLTDKQRKKLYYLVVGIIIVGLIAGLSFTWFSATVSGNENAQKTTAETAADIIISKAPTTTGTINTDGLTKVEQPATGQTPAQTEYRYSGSDVKNYVTFNDETWRIIGVFSTDDGTGNYENRVKIMRDASIGNAPWDSNYVNEWSTASLKTELNGTYYNGLSSTAQNMIDNAKWYTSSYDPDGATSSIAYTSERASTTEKFGSRRKTNWTGKIALAYPSDYGYASSGCYAGSKDIHYYSDTTCKNSNWMFKGANMWLLSPTSAHASLALTVYSGGSVGSYLVGDYGYGVWPVTYLKSRVKITGGSGTSSDPYTLGL